MVGCSGIVRGEPQAPVPVIIFGGFCNWSVRGEVLGFPHDDKGTDLWGHRQPLKSGFQRVAPLTAEELKKGILDAVFL